MGDPTVEGGGGGAKLRRENLYRQLVLDLRDGEYLITYHQDELIYVESHDAEDTLMWRLAGSPRFWFGDAT